ncbi:TRAP transporter small permease subunit [Boseongicola aestuarii]|uniref:TRAP transporter small permease protein n=1 Tax=Boseongicola aestuarii TaxID=1470561 RepID=A0A238IWN9_9RHOB|nr:TRAP transporter small permease [Boseongicola aestuarii]SMX22837.1 2,3-diketo-L-gulonate TRAP transporter small permease protein YiaM [Boseongicola aestuarii]
MKNKSGSFIEWLIPFCFILCAGWLIWHLPAFTLDWVPPDQSQADNLRGLHHRNDVTPGMSGPFGGEADWVDYLALLGLPIFLYIGIRTVRRAPMEFESWRPADRVSVFIGRVTMMMIILLTSVMLYEVLLRYVFEAPTLWANELSLWLAGFVFLCAGLYAMQQRSHIRIFLLYDICPRWMQRLFDTISTVLIVLFAFFLVYGGYGEALDKLWRWETFGTAFDPPIPATLKPTVLIIVSLVAIQAVVNLISDWNAEPVIHTAADDIDQDELEKIRAAVGAEGVGDLDVTRGSIQGNQTERN